MKLIMFLIGVVLLLRSAHAASTQDSFVLLNQGWNAADVEQAFGQNLGTELMPARWFMALERLDSNQKFAQNLDRFGFVIRGSGLPVGVTFDENEATSELYGERKWIGVNCAACHTSVLEVKAKNILIQGNQSQVRLQDFEEGIIRSVEATLTDSAKMARFASALNENSVSDLGERLLLFRNEFKSWYGRNHQYFDQAGREVRWGPGRIDGLGGSTNDLACQLTPRLSASSFLTSIFVSPENCGPAHAPTSIPHLWGMTNEDLVQWNGEVHASLGRNLGALMAGYGKNWVEATLLGIPKVMTTVKIKEVADTEELYKKLRAPSWKQMVELQVGPSLEVAKVASGKKLFENNCMSCHAVQPRLTEQNKFGNRYWDYPLIPIQEVGTDPYYTNDEIKHKTKISPLIAPLYLAVFGFSDIQLNGQVPAYLARGIVPAAALANYFRENAVSLAGIDQMNNCRDNKRSDRMDVIKARSLEGVLFTAPYLHNASVPTIYALLEKAIHRPKKFFVGCRKYDLDKFGPDCRAEDQNAFEFDTTLQGNGNSGHEYGTDLSTNEKTELVEYIKSLEQPTFVPGNTECF